ncbi:hypothetical protein MAE02_62340 [Microvirga aerophila]|uniref:Uncharacterized protein n=1 Tax=Microvirga aerophila TaxID=670291 RepID=A0A512C2U8_9HYPH|nr:hypothetical protein MAE02_62340 [Microvirga aerophila]
MCDARAPEPEQAGRWKASTLIKTFGQDMMADPGFAANIIEPLKMQGVERFGDFAIQIRRGEQRIDAQQVVRPGTILVFLEPLHEAGLDGVTPGSSCIANAYTSNHDLIGSGQVGATRGWSFTRWMRSVSCMR